MLTPKSCFLNSGGKYFIRNIQSTDKDYLIHLFDSLSTQSRYFRFAHAMSSLPEPMLEHLVSILPSNPNEIALVAEIPHSDQPPSQGQLVGITRCVGEPQKNRCEFSLSVSDDFHGEGVGSQLLINLIDHAHNKGFTEIYGYVLSENHDMLQLMKHLGFKISPIAGDSDFKLVTHSV